MSDELLRVYLDPEEVVSWGDMKGYPKPWVGRTRPVDWPAEEFCPDLLPRIPDYVREQAGHRCVRCGHPFVVGETPGEWSPCDEHCTHGEPVRWDSPAGEDWMPEMPEPQRYAQWRVLTVHHLNGVKHDCRWWNLVALCQRCHLTIQGKVYMERPWLREHSAWFKPYVAGFYAWHYLGLELTREEAMARLEELLDLEHRQLELGG